ncbi:hypothetical protein FS837_005450, partial [Tulasnella sp. UAMH 9824]
MRNKESRPTGSARLPGSHPEISSHRLELSTKLTAKLEQLAQWRLHPSSIKFLEEAPEVQGGYATVSRALLAAPSDREDGSDRLTNAKEGVTVGLHDRKGKSSSRASGSEGDLDVEKGKEGTRRRMKMKLKRMGRDLMMALLGSRGTDSSSSSRVAYKTVAVKKMKTSEDIARILRSTLREAEFLVELSHPNIIILYGFVEDIPNNIIWLVFPWADSGSLRDFAASTDWEIPERISLISDVTSGVEYLHSRKPPIRHGDLKSINILVNSESRAIITDFGSARRLTAKDLGKGRAWIETRPQGGALFKATFCESTQTMTLTGDKYTLRWAAPELLKDTEPGLWSDIWALGWVAYEPTAIPDRTPTEDTAGTRGRSPDLLMKLGSMYGQQRDYTNASMYYTKALSVCTDTADSRGKASALWRLAEIHRFQNDYTEAITTYSECLQICNDIGDRGGKAMALWGLAEVHRGQTSYDQAITVYSQCLQMWTDIGDRARKADALYSLAEVHRARNDYSQAITSYS